MAGQRGRQGDTGRVGDTGRTGDEGEPGAAGAAGAVGEPGGRGKPGTPISTGLWRVLLAAAAALILIAVVMSTVTLVQGARINKNTDRIEALSNRTAEREALDTQNLREAAWRGCQRDQLERADTYANQRESLNSPQVREAFSDIDIDRIVARRQKLLPLFNCDPNMCDESATVLPLKKQDRFVDQYVAGDLPPNPEPPKVKCP